MEVSTVVFKFASSIDTKISTETWMPEAAGGITAILVGADFINVMVPALVTKFAVA